MKFNKLGSSETEITKTDGTVILISYNTPVAAQLASGGFIKTSTKHSKTTSKHINKWLEGANAQEVDQSVLDGLM